MDENEPVRAGRLRVRGTRTPERTAQEAADAYERSRTGGLFFCIVWALICMTAGQDGLREWLIGAGFLLLALLRLAVGVLRWERNSLAGGRAPRWSNYARR